MGRNCILFKGLVFKSAYHFHISNSPYQTIKNEYLQASFELAFLLLCKNTYLFGLFMQFFQGLLSWTRSDNLTCIDTICNLLTLYDLNLGYRGVYLETTTSLKKLTCSRNSIQLNSLGPLICTLISENKVLEKSRSDSNLRKISGPANLNFFQF